MTEKSGRGGRPLGVRFDVLHPSPVNIKRFIFLSPKILTCERSSNC